MAHGNPVRYTSRTFQSIMNDINSDQELYSKPNWWKRLWAGVGDVLSIWLNAVVNLLFLRTAYTRSAVTDLCELIDYTLSAQSTSSGKAFFYVKTSLGPAIFPFSVLIADLIAKSVGTLQVASKTFESRTDENFTLVQNASVTADHPNDQLVVTLDFEYTGHKVWLGTTGILPSPLQINTDYYVIYDSATRIRLAETIEDAYAGNAIDLTDNGSGSTTITLYSKYVTIYQQETIAEANIIGASDGSTEWQEFDLPNTLVLPETVAIVINSITWTAVETFIDSIGSDTHYKIIPKADGTFSIRFGNGIYGAIPPAFDIFATYATGGGTNSNVPVQNRVSIYSGGDSNLTGVSNLEGLAGGTDEESLESAKRLGPLLLKARDRFITTLDGEALVLAYGGVAQARVIKNFYGVLSSKIVGVAFGGGDPSSALRLAIQAFLIDRTILESITVIFDGASFITINVTASAKLLPGYTWANVEPFFELAFILFTTETGNEIRADYLANGIESAVDLINLYFSKSFLPADYPDIQQLLDHLEPPVGPRAFGDTIQDSDISAYIQPNVEGIDYMAVASFGSGLPLSLADDEITRTGTLTLTEIP